MLNLKNKDDHEAIVKDIAYSLDALKATDQAVMLIRSDGTYALALSGFTAADFNCKTMPITPLDKEKITVKVIEDQPRSLLPMQQEVSEAAYTFLNELYGDFDGNISQIANYLINEISDRWQGCAKELADFSRLQLGKIDRKLRLQLAEAYLELAATQFELVA